MGWDDEFDDEFDEETPAGTARPPSVDWGTEKMTHRKRVLHRLWDLEWHAHTELKVDGGVRYGARLLELKREGYLIEDEYIDGRQVNGKRYRLVSHARGEGQGKRVKVYLEPIDVEMIMDMLPDDDRARKALDSALASFRANEHKL